jgi:hypothetical protein
VKLFKPRIKKEKPKVDPKKNIVSKIKLVLSKLTPRQKGRVIKKVNDYNKKYNVPKVVALAILLGISGQAIYNKGINANRIVEPVRIERQTSSELSSRTKNADRLILESQRRSRPLRFLLSEDIKIMLEKSEFGKIIADELIRLQISKEKHPIILKEILEIEDEIKRIRSKSVNDHNFKDEYFLLNRLAVFDSLLDKIRELERHSLFETSIAYREFALKKILDWTDIGHLLLIEEHLSLSNYLKGNSLKENLVEKLAQLISEHKRIINSNFITRVSGVNFYLKLSSLFEEGNNLHFMKGEIDKILHSYDRSIFYREMLTEKMTAREHMNVAESYRKSLKHIKRSLSEYEFFNSKDRDEIYKYHYDDLKYQDRVSEERRKEIAEKRTRETLKMVNSFKEHNSDFKRIELEVERLIKMHDDKVSEIRGIASLEARKENTEDLMSKLEEGVWKEDINDMDHYFLKMSLIEQDIPIQNEVVSIIEEIETKLMGEISEDWAIRSLEKITMFKEYAPHVAFRLVRLINYKLNSPEVKKKVAEVVEEFQKVLKARLGTSQEKRADRQAYGGFNFLLRSLYN